eukprot:Rhum_TRINITY_DN14598_c10_g2::Rhum_TRINITY_DN14598_c10_g2_i1::g.100867::m.100867
MAMDSGSINTLDVPLNTYADVQRHATPVQGRVLRADFVALGQEKRSANGTRALEGNCGTEMTDTRHDLAHTLSDAVRDTASPVVRKMYPDERRVCADLAISKFVVTEQGTDKVLQEEKGNFTLETTDRRLLVSGTYESPSAEEVDSEQPTSQYRHRTTLRYSYMTRHFRWQFPLGNIQGVSVLSGRGCVAKRSVTTHRKPWIIIVTILLLLSFGIASGITFTDPVNGLQGPIVLLSFALASVLFGCLGWHTSFKARVTPKSLRQVDETVIQISGTSPQEMTGVKVALTVLNAYDHIGNIDDFFETVNPDHAPRVSRMPLSDASHSTHVLKTVETVQ